MDNNNQEVLPENPEGTLEDEQILIADAEGEIVAPLLHLRHVAGVLPGAKQDAPLVALEGAGVVADTPRYEAPQWGNLRWKKSAAWRMSASLVPGSVR